MTRLGKSLIMSYILYLNLRSAQIQNQLNARVLNQSYGMGEYQ